MKPLASQHFDFVIAGSGLAGLMLAYKMTQKKGFGKQRILLVDATIKDKNDRTWCFWQKPNSAWSSLAKYHWNGAFFKSERGLLQLNLSPFTYQMMRAADFYSFVLSYLETDSNVFFLKDTVQKIDDQENQVKVRTKASGVVTAKKVFSSLWSPNDLEKQQQFPYLKQHFKGWFVRTENPIFDSNNMTFMDFSVPQKGNTRFMYVLPFSQREALVEYTLFSEDLLADSEYEAAMKNYLKNHKSGRVEILEKEQGNIPMTAYPFHQKNTTNVLYIGTAGGWTKASTGFTFSKTDRETDRLISFLDTKKDFTAFHQRNRFDFYDLLILDVLHKNNALGSEIFTAIFQKNKPEKVLRFLDEQTSLWEELQIIWSCPKRPFLQAFLKRLRMGLFF
jgi:lycopene beta-cyclase